MTIPNETQIEAIARAAHEVHRAWCIAHGDTSQKPWESADQHQRASAINNIRTALDGATAEQQHIAWAAEKFAAGWRYGTEKDAEAKTHPCLVPYAELPPEQRAKDALYGDTVRSMARAFASLESR